jgi:hypothetical protein
MSHTDRTLLHTGGSYLAPKIAIAAYLWAAKTF